MDHLSDEEISAAVDGDLTGGAGAHLAGCDACSARRGELAAVAVAVGSVDRTPPDIADRLISVALAASRDDDASGAVAVVAPSRRAGSRVTRVTRVAAAAAVLVVLAGSAVAVLASRQRRAPRPAASAAAASGAAAGADMALRLTVDLGDQADIDALVAEVQQRSPAPTDPVWTGRTTSAAAATGPAAARDGSAADQGPSEAAGALSATAGEPSTPSSTTPPSSARCVSAGARAVGTGARPPFAAHLRWQGTDAEVLVYWLPGSGSDHLDRRALVMDRSSCAVLADRRF